MPDIDSKITIESATSPGHVQRVDRAKYMAVRDALFGIALVVLCDSLGRVPGHLHRGAIES